MATLCLDPEFESRAHCDLHEWLDGDWALLFSNPEDFRQDGLGKQSWLDDLGTRQVRALAVKRDHGSFEPSWLGEVNWDRQLVRLREPPFAAGDAISFAVRALRGQLLTQPSRFVLIVDGGLKRRGLLIYNGGCNHLSALDLLASIDAMRRGSSIGLAA